MILGEYQKTIHCPKMHTMYGFKEVITLQKSLFKRYSHFIAFVQNNEYPRTQKDELLNNTVPEKAYANAINFASAKPTKH